MGDYAQNDFDALYRNRYDYLLRLACRSTKELSRFRGPGRRSVCCLFAKVRYHTYQQSECVLGKSPVKPDMQLPKAEDT